MGFHGARRYADGLEYTQAWAVYTLRTRTVWVSSATRRSSARIGLPEARCSFHVEPFPLSPPAVEALEMTSLLARMDTTITRLILDVFSRL